jgi:hypothetical protein
LHAIRIQLDGIQRQVDSLARSIDQAPYDPYEVPATPRANSNTGRNASWRDVPPY